MSPRFPRPPFFLFACLLTILTASPLSAQTGGATSELETLSPSGQESRDYFLPGELPQGAGSYRTLEARAGSLTVAAATAGGFPIKSTISYTSFLGLTYTLRAYSGKYVTWALPDSAIGGTTGLSDAEIRKLVSLTDLFYARLTSLVGGEPFGDGVLLNIALVDTGGVAGIGAVGSKGSEVNLNQLDQIKMFLAKELLPKVVTHELLHNFDIYSWPNAYLNYYGDFGHAWVAFGQNYMQTYDRSGYYDLTPETALSLNYKEFVGPWDLAGPAASWATCVRDGGGCESLNIQANQAWAGLLIRYAKLHGSPII
ncbi:MAG TPA: hypothetical protein VJT74_02845, partial [Pyrinomonadaceae bacterium]|nr:hypothetical protein [Pyrinomonadaceae bacterium]